MESNQRVTLALELMELIDTGNAHLTFDDAIIGLPVSLRNVTPDKLPYSIWQLIDHMRITLEDIVEFCTDANHQSPKWPEEYWTQAPDVLNDRTWDDTLEQIKKNKDRFFDLLKDHKNDLLFPFPHGKGQNLLRQAMLIADHNSYHIGQIVLIRRLLGNWKVQG